MLRQLRGSILPAKVIMTVNAVNADGTVTATTAGGLTQRVIGSASVDDKIYVQDRRVLGTAPTLPHVNIEV